MTSVVKKFAAYAKLLRLSNAPTAVADVWMGYAVVSGELKPTLPLALMTLASLCLYHGGMALNDAVDAHQDGIDRRGRPIEFGLISRSTAYAIANALMVFALTLAAIAVSLVDNPGPFVMAAMLAVCVRFYNSKLKRTLLGPLFMGMCRVCNVSLGAIVGAAANPLAYAAIMRPISAGILLYVIGLTVFARDEAHAKRRGVLDIGLTLCLAGVGILGFSPLLSDGIPNNHQPTTWAIFWIAATLIATRGMVAGILQPTPRNIGRGVGIAIQGLVVIDATLATLYAGPVAGLAILALLPVTMLLARWIPQT